MGVELPLVVLAQSHSAAQPWVQRLTSTVPHASVRSVDSLADAAEIVANGHCRVLVAVLAANGVAWPDALAVARAGRPQVPLLLVAPHRDEDEALRAIAAGADDYVLAETPARLAHAVQQLVRRADTVVFLSQNDHSTADHVAAAQALVERCGIGLALVPLRQVNDGGDNIAYVSPAMARMFGYTQAEFARLSIADLTHPDDLAPDLALAQRMVAGELDFYEIEKRCLRKDGSIFWAHVTVSLVRDVMGLPSAVVSTLQEIQARKETEARLTDSERYFRAIFDSSRDGYLVAEADTRRFVLANQAICDLLGYDREQIVQLGVADIHPPEQLASVIETFERQLRGEQDIAVDIPVRRKDGTVLLADITQTTLEIAGRKLVVGAFRDVTSRHAMELQIARAERMASLGRLAASVAHEVNNPLTYMLQSLSSIVECAAEFGSEFATRSRKSSSPELPALRLTEILDNARRARTGAERIREIAAGLRRFSRVEPGKRISSSVNQILEEALEIADGEIRHRARVVLELGDIPSVLTEPGPLCQVFVNLLVNAAHAMSVGKIDENCLHVRTWLSGNDVCVEIADTGHGIPKHLVHKVFEPFFSTKDASTKDAAVGMGLGLSISQNIMTALGGSIALETEEGHGTRVIVRLPRATAEVQAASHSADGAIASAKTKSLAQAPRVNRGRVLIVDDDELVAHAVQNALKREYEVVVAIGGRAARSLLDSDSNFDVVVLDLMMPDVSGMDLFGWLEEHHVDLCPRVLFVTGGAFTLGSQQFLDSVSNPRLEKPFAQSDLLHAVRGLITSVGRRTTAP